MTPISPETMASIILASTSKLYVNAHHKYYCWFKFKNHRWINIPDHEYWHNDINAGPIEKLITKYLATQYEKQDQLLKLAATSSTKNIIDELVIIAETIKQLNDKDYRDCIVIESADILYDGSFYNKIDSNNNLIGFSNGVYDLQTATFRDGRPDDYITLTTGYDYVKYGVTDQSYNDIIKFMACLQPDVETQKYLFDVLASCLVGGNPSNHLYIFTGSNKIGIDNLIRLIKSTFGNLYASMCESMLRHDQLLKDSNDNGIRVGILEFNQHERPRLNSTCIKLLTCNDIISKTSRRPISFTSIVSSGSLPYVDSDDDATWRRIVTIEFDTNDDMTELDEIMYRQTFMSMLIEQYIKLQNSGSVITCPNQVIESAISHRVNCNMISTKITNDCQIL